MKILPLVIITFLLKMISGNENIVWVKRVEEQKDRNILQSLFLSNKRANSDAYHTCVFQIKAKTGGISKLEQILADVSNPNSPNYGKYLLKSQVEDIASDKEAKAIVDKYLISSGVKIIKSSSDYITAEASISLWERLLNTQFYEINNNNNNNLDIIDNNGKEVVYFRSHDYSLPSEIDQYVSTVFNTFQIPVKIKHL